MSRHSPGEGSWVELTLTGIVVGQGTEYITVKVDGQPRDLIYIVRDNPDVVIEVLKNG